MTATTTVEAPARHPDRYARYKHVPATFDELLLIDRQLVETARTLVRPDGTVSPSEVGRKHGLDAATASHRVARLRRWGFWPWDVPESGGRGRIDPADVVKVLEESREESLEVMRDGRHEVDDPRVHGVCAVPSGGAGLAPARGLAEIVGGYLIEWRLIVAGGMGATGVGQAAEPHALGGTGPT